MVAEETVMPVLLTLEITGGLVSAEGITAETSFEKALISAGFAVRSYREVPCACSQIRYGVIRFVPDISYAAVFA